MPNDPMSWIDEQSEEIQKAREEGYFSIEEGDNRIQLLSHAAPFPQVYDPSIKKYRPAEEGDKNISVRGVCWVLQDGKIKEAKLPYTVMKAVRELQQDHDWAFSEFPMPRLINIKAKNAGTKEVEYTVIPSPKETPVSQEILDELKAKPTPEERVESLKDRSVPAKPDYPEHINPQDIPF